MPQAPNAIMGHFLYPAAAVAVSLGQELGIPAFVSTGELSEVVGSHDPSGKRARLLNTLVPMGVNRARNDFSGAAGFIANSTFLARLVQENLGVSSTMVGMFPNGIDRRHFFPRDKEAIRRKFDLPRDQFLVGFVGSYIPRKGADRVGRAIAGLEGVGGVFIGGGSEPPKGENVIFCKRLPHKTIPEMLSACDAFVLPTTDEGCCNAILEAMACGLPIISSTGAFNDDILNPEVSIRVDPMDPVALRAAIKRLRDDSVLQQRMAEAALRWSGRFDVDVRAEGILTFMNRRVQQGAFST
jgi:glycosyltransferase involved in cell wall biosynthesis